MGPLGITPPRLRVALIAVLAALAAMAVAGPALAGAAPSVSVTCDPATVEPAEKTHCLARVDTGSAGTPAGGKVSFVKASGPVVNLGSGACQVQPESGGVGFCSLDVSGLVEGKVSIFALYSQTGVGLATGTGSFTIATRAAVHCLPDEPVVQDSTECRVFIPGIAEGPEQPTGLVEWSASGPAEAGDIDPECTLQPVAEGSSCSVTFTPSAMGENAVLAEYGGDGIYPGRDISRIVTVAPTHETRTVLECDFSNPVSFSRIRCTATAFNVSQSGGAPVGSVAFEAMGSPGAPPPGLFPDSNGCILKPMAEDPKAASCSVRYQPSPVLQQTVKATSAGSPLFKASSATFRLEVLESNPTSTSIVCQTVSFGAVGKCIATVADLSVETFPPWGQISFSANGATEFIPKSCQPTAVSFAAARCEVSYMPFAVGSLTLNAEYQGDPSLHAFSLGSTNVLVKGVIGAQ